MVNTDRSLLTQRELVTGNIGVGAARGTSLIDVGQHVDDGDGAMKGVVKTHAQSILELLDRYGREIPPRSKRTVPTTRAARPAGNETE
jgi:hypothetical protein